MFPEDNDVRSKWIYFANRVLYFAYRVFNILIVPTFRETTAQMKRLDETVQYFNLVFNEQTGMLTVL